MRRVESGLVLAGWFLLAGCGDGSTPKAETGIADNNDHSGPSTGRDRDASSTGDPVETKDASSIGTVHATDAAQVTLGETMDCGTCSPDDGGVACGELTDAPCGADEWCDFRGDRCGTVGDALDTGVCRKRPTECADGCPGFCGCDLGFYCSPCLAQSAGVDVFGGSLDCL